MRTPAARRGLIVGITGVASLSLLTGCVQSVVGTSRGPGDLVVALREAPDALDPTTASSYVGRIVYANMCEKLYDIDARQNIVPQLAASLPTISKDARSYTIKLRPGVLFNDGTPMDAQSVKTSLDRHRNHEQSQRAGELKLVRSVDVVDPLTVRLNLSGPFAPLTSVLADRSGMVLSPAQLRRLGDNFARNPVCVGPFSFVRRPSADEIQLAKSQHYYAKDRVRLRRLVFRSIPDDSVRAADLRAGDVDVIERTAPQDVEALEEDPDLRIARQTSLGYQGLYFNVGNAQGSLKDPGPVNNPFARHPALRQAFELSLDRSVITKVVFSGQYTPGCSPIPPKSPWAVKVPCPGRDVAQARRLIAQTGLKPPIKVRLMVNNIPLLIQLGTIVQAMAKDAGFDVRLEPTDFASALDRGEKGQFEIFQIGWSGRIDPDQNVYAEWYPKNGLNYSGANFPDVNRVLDQARAATDVATRKRLYDQAVRLFHEKRSLIYLWHDELVLGYHKGVTGVVFTPDGLIHLATAYRG